MYGHFYPIGFGVDWTYFLIIAAFLFSLVVQGVMKSTFSRYERVGAASGLTGAETARRILESEGLYSVEIRHVRGSLTDHYDPRNRTVNLSDDVYASRSLAAVGVAAHECGHAIQHARAYVPLSIRSALVPIANFGSGISWFVFVLGLIMSLPFLTRAGIFLFSGALLFQLVTLPVEFNASRRALQKLNALGILEGREVGGARKVLGAAAMTYVAATLASLAQLMRMILLSGGSRRRD